MAVIETRIPTERYGDSLAVDELGMKQRLALAGTLLADPDLLVLDEPTSGLDPEGMRDIRRLIRRPWVGPSPAPRPAASRRRDL